MNAEIDRCMEESDERRKEEELVWVVVEKTEEERSYLRAAVYECEATRW